MKTNLFKPFARKALALPALVGGLTLAIACGGSNGSPASSDGRLKLDISGLEDLGDDYKYEGWMIVNGQAITTGVFDVDSSGNLETTDFDLDSTDLDDASAFVLTIEPFPDSDPAPSDTHILAGDFSGNLASIIVSHSSALGTDFGTSSGNFILATPSDDSTNSSNPEEGIWWLNPTTGPGASLTLPTLPNGWVYEGWLVGPSGPQSTGTFTSVSGADSDGAGATGGSDSAPAFPGQDILGIDLNDGNYTAVISVEPSPDNSSSPFTFKPLVKAIDNGAATAPTAHTMGVFSTNTLPTGTASR
jgi:hypothetical protein